MRDSNPRPLAALGRSCRRLVNHSNTSYLTVFEANLPEILLNLSYTAYMTVWNYTQFHTQ